MHAIFTIGIFSSLAVGILAQGNETVGILETYEAAGCTTYKEEVPVYEDTDLATLDPRVVSVRAGISKKCSRKFPVPISLPSVR